MSSMSKSARSAEKPGASCPTSVGEPERGRPVHRRREERLGDAHVQLAHAEGEDEREGSALGTCRG